MTQTTKSTHVKCKFCGHKMNHFDSSIRLVGVCCQGELCLKCSGKFCYGVSNVAKD